jgi:hypothetical protein
MNFNQNVTYLFKGCVLKLKQKSILNERITITIKIHQMNKHELILNAHFIIIYLFNIILK